MDELKQNEYKMAKPPAAAQPSRPPSQKKRRMVKEAKILVYGLPGSGKTSIINKLSEIVGQPQVGADAAVSPTHMFNVNRLFWPSPPSGDVKLTVFDFGGARARCLLVLPACSCGRRVQSCLVILRPAHWRGSAARTGREEWRRSLWKSYYDQADALVWVVDSTDRKNLEACRDELLGMLGALGVLPPRSPSV